MRVIFYPSKWLRVESREDKREAVCLALNKLAFPFAKIAERIGDGDIGYVRQADLHQKLKAAGIKNYRPVLATLRAEGFLTPAGRGRERWCPHPSASVPGLSLPDNTEKAEALFAEGGIVHAPPLEESECYLDRRGGLGDWGEKETARRKPVPTKAKARKRHV